MSAIVDVIDKTEKADAQEMRMGGSLAPGGLRVAQGDLIVDEMKHLGIQSIQDVHGSVEGGQDASHMASLWGGPDVFVPLSSDGLLFSSIGGLSNGSEKSSDLSAFSAEFNPVLPAPEHLDSFGGLGKKKKERKVLPRRRHGSASEGAALSTNKTKNKKENKEKVSSSGDVDAVDKVKRTVYVADVHHQVTEQELARFFSDCGPIVDYRICGDTNTVLRFAFIEFHSVGAAKEALSLSGSTLGESTIRVSPSKTAIIPVKDQFLPRSEREREAVARTVYVANIHKTVERDVLRQFFQMVCGPVSKIRLLGDAQHDTKIAFVEFASKEYTNAALRCTGAMLGPLAIRVSPSKTPVRTDAKRRVSSDVSHLSPDAASAAAKLTQQLKQSLRQGAIRQKKSNVKPQGGSGGSATPGEDTLASPTIISLLEGILSD
ncbi:Polyadenylate-binding protein-interacting protein 8 [Picochlorum sp. SENEW3]|nr:Polyadenylate-binding protein-interacting protein 8 [Picochlorum sp. SENEW3]